MEEFDIMKIDPNDVFYWINCFVISIQAGLKCGEIYWTFTDKQSVYIGIGLMATVHILFFIINYIFFRALPRKNRRKT